ncbi:MAG: protein translocase subunit SecF [Chloroflexi bacterium]|nr:protein translocase subunit SecF [Chloroflexota bacterium]
MLKLVEKKRWYFIISAIMIIPGLISMIVTTIGTGSPFRTSIDFNGGSLWEVQFTQPITPSEIMTIFKDNGYSDVTVQTVTNDRTVSIRTVTLEQEEKQALLAKLQEKYGEATELRFSSVGPSIGQETTRAAVVAIIATSLATLLFVALAFRKVPHAFRYGVCATLKMVHDILFLLGLASILGNLVGWEVDSLFLTAVLTVVGFSVQDVIVVFDRIRENVQKYKGEDLDTIIDRSLTETLKRSLTTQLNSIFVMVAIILFGGVTIRQFLLTMLIGMVAGTYSSLFFAVPLLSVWNNRVLRRQQHGTA